MIIRGRGVIINRGIRLQIINGRAVPIVANAAPKPTASEQIEHLVVGADRIVFSTSSTVGVADADAPATGNRIVSVSLSDGHVLWQTRLTDRSIAQIIANDDFVAVRAVAEGDVRLIAFDAQSGQPVWRPKPFSRDNDDVATPVNMALAQDGSLVYVMADRLCCKDLFDPDQKLRFEHPVPHGGTTSTFLHCEAADQLLVRDGRIVVVTDAGMFVRIYSLLDGQPASREGNGETLLSTGIVSPWERAPAPGRRSALYLRAGSRGALRVEHSEGSLVDPDTQLAGPESDQFGDPRHDRHADTIAAAPDADVTAIDAGERGREWRFCRRRRSPCRRAGDGNADADSRGEPRCCPTAVKPEWKTATD